MKIFFSFFTLSLTFSSQVSADIFDWDQNKDYNAGVTVVVKEGDNAGSYTSLQSVNAGTPITSTDFWYNLFLESNLPDYVKAGENPDEEGLSLALEGGPPNIADIPEDLPPNTDTSTGGGDTSTGGGDTSTGGGDTSTGGGDTSTGGGDTSTGGGDTSTGGGDTSTGGGDTSTGGGDTSTGGGDTSTGGGDTNTGGGDTTIDARFLGISTRGPISADKKLYGGLTVLGTESKKVAFMAKGSSMAAQNITDYATDPLLEISRKVYSEEKGKKVWETYRTVDDWGDVDSSESILLAEGQTGVILPTGAEEAGIVLDLEPGNYTFIVSSPTDRSGTKQAIVEAYELSE
jgi:hypothetical protein